ncbi:hypothetical protein AB0D08_21115 [Kitasatospora sp. NPDC048540]|uniref:hypothetical protein n=1 Tax=unclassified Kitasatospora TaxID=2633591 RepID=UPI00053A9B21|nr:hypothetical protein [Kitasatospora sp. MBT63]
MDAGAILACNYQQAISYQWSENLVPAHFMMYCATNWGTESRDDVVTNYSKIAAQARACADCAQLAGVLKWMLETNHIPLQQGWIPSEILGYKIISQGGVQAFSSTGADLFAAPLRIMQSACKHVSTGAALTISSDDEEDLEDYELVADPGVVDFYARLKGLSSFSNIETTWYDYQVDWNGGNHPMDDSYKPQPVTQDRMNQLNSDIDEVGRLHDELLRLEDGRLTEKARRQYLEAQAEKARRLEGTEKENFLRGVVDEFVPSQQEKLPEVERIPADWGLPSLPKPDAGNPAAAKYALGYSGLSGNAWRLLTDEGGGSELLTNIVVTAETTFWGSLPNEYKREAGEEDQPGFEAFMIINETWKEQRADLCGRFGAVFRARVVEPSHRVLMFHPSGNEKADTDSANWLLHGNYESMAAFVALEGSGAIDDFIAAIRTSREEMMSNLLKRETEKVKAMIKEGLPQDEAKQRIRYFRDSANIFTRCFTDARRLWRESAKGAVRHLG